MRRRLDYNQEVAKTMRNSGICLFAEEWPQRILSHRFVKSWSYFRVQSIAHNVCYSLLFATLFASIG